MMKNNYVTDSFTALSEATIITRSTIIDLITEHAPISAQSSNLVVFRLQPVYFYLLLYKTYVVGTHLNCLDKSRQFK